jgi:hypothetical protein
MRNHVVYAALRDRCVRTYGEIDAKSLRNRLAIEAQSSRNHCITAV